MPYTFTKQITSSFTTTLNDVDGCIALSVKAATAGGSVSVIGNFPFKGLTPSALTFTDGDGLTLTAPNSALPLSGITITWISGTVELVVSVA